MSESNHTPRDIFNVAVEITDAQQRADYLAQACGADTALLQMVGELIAANEDAGRFLGGAGDTVAKAARNIPSTTASSGQPDGPTLRRFGDYELGEALGRGGMGVVYEATQVSLHRTVALKMILDSEAASLTSRRRFTLEAETAAKLNHPNIVPVYEVGEHEGQPFLSMKFIAGENLRKKIVSGDLCLITKGNSTSKTDFRDRAIAIARLVATMAHAVHHAHENGVLHRDLKPANIIVDRDGQPHLTDFGLAKLLEPKVGASTHAPITISGAVLGTPSYMSPEQAAGRRLSVASDIYSLGAILYEMLAGRPPFQAGTLLETLRMAAEQEAKRPGAINPRIDRDLDTICIKCLEKNPIARYPTAEALAGDLERWLRHEPIQARPAGVSLRLRRWTRRNRAVAALIVGLGAGLAGALLLLQMVNAEKGAKEKALAEAERQEQSIKAQLFRRLDQLEVYPERGYPEIITSEDRSIVTGGLVPVVSAGTRLMRYTVGIYSRQSPTEMMTQFAPILSYLETNLTEPGAEVIRLDLVIYGTYEQGIRALLQREVDIMRLGPASYVIARQQNPALGLVAAQNYQGVLRGAIFTREGSGVTNLAGLKGSGRFAFGDKDSTSGNFLSKGVLLDAGLNASSLVACCTNLKNHSKVLDAVADGQYIAGAGNASGVELRDEKLRQEGKSGLRILQRFKEPLTPWVTRENLPRELVSRLRARLLTLTDTNVLGAFRDKVTGFREADPSDYDELEKDMRKARLFESR